MSLFENLNDVQAERLVGGAAGGGWVDNGNGTYTKTWNGNGSSTSNSSTPNGPWSLNDGVTSLFTYKNP